MKRLFSDYGMVFALLILCVLFSWLTWDEQNLTGAAGGEQLARLVIDAAPAGAAVLVVTRDAEDDRELAQVLSERLGVKGMRVIDVVQGSPRDARLALERASREGPVDVVACSPAVAEWPLMAGLGTAIPALSEAKVLAPTIYYWPNFLKADNLLNVANQIVVIAVVAIGMTMVIITAGIDLSVGSLIALSAVAAGWMIREFAGATDAGTVGMILCCLAGIGLCAAMGLFSGGMVALFRVPPFIVTLGMMLVASGLAYTLAGGESIYQV
ncbi:MAG: ABC transporter permease, partial [Planctomycetes bacterium]|nr:ABC transporter permease [Planctomycetota bacterium]